ncbi:uncharacterized protein B0H18DRAFT_1054954 [Fomitopsis serialis]|uniref:uncharacterized protein n=1 Tax=Fomitopsis serialis TaxID=139415 RepID=UPI0020076DE7|nr:uncharacterized protein B0H18DRAFT_1054954 [Neoantrodia serialis]KAH9912283.1 hypothetical protein B0H18DRAFT_1054954 [Neoantrodia serialis]
MADAIPQSDVSRPSALPTANLLQRPIQPLVDQNSNEYLDAIEEEWNKKVDVEVDTLVDGMVDLVGLASIGDKDKFRIAQESYQAECRAESMIRAAHSLLSIIHSMKLLLLLSDESQIANRRDAEMRDVQAEKDTLKKEVAGKLDEILHQGRSGRWPESQ